MRSEHDFTIDWRRLFRNGNVNAKSIRKAQQLIDDLPGESPLRCRYGQELNELRRSVKKLQRTRK